MSGDRHIKLALAGLGGLASVAVATPFVKQRLSRACPGVDGFPQEEAANRDPLAGKRQVRELP